MKDLDWQALNAMADGELDAAGQAALAARLSREGRLVAGLGQITSLKAALAEVGAGAPPMPQVEATPPRVRFSPGRIAAAAACLALLVLPFGRMTQPTPFELALASHRAFVSAEDGVDSSGVVMAQAMRPKTIVPDLSDAGLVVRYVATEMILGQEALHLGYVGSRGCRVSLWMRAGAPAFAPAAPAGRSVAAAWHANGVAYLLLASGMPVHRFQVIAATAERVTREAGEIAVEERLALRAGRAASAPCVG